MKNFVLGLMIALFALTSTYGGECVSGNCAVARLPRRIVTLSTQVVNVPVEVTTRTVNRVRRFSRKASCGCVCEATKVVETSTQPTLAEPAPSK